MIETGSCVCVCKYEWVDVPICCWYSCLVRLSQVSLVAVAPLTNLALAVRLDPSLPSKLRGLYIMGGNTECKENRLFDPHSQHLLLFTLVSFYVVFL